MPHSLQYAGPGDERSFVPQSSLSNDFDGSNNEGSREAETLRSHSVEPENTQESNCVSFGGQHFGYSQPVFSNPAQTGQLYPLWNVQEQSVGSNITNVFCSNGPLGYDNATASATGSQPYSSFEESAYLGYVGNHRASMDSFVGRNMPGAAPFGHFIRPMSSYATQALSDNRDSYGDQDPVHGGDVLTSVMDPASLDPAGMIQYDADDVAGPKNAGFNRLPEGGAGGFDRDDAPAWMSDYGQRDPAAALQLHPQSLLRSTTDGFHAGYAGAALRSELNQSRDGLLSAPYLPLPGYHIHGQAFHPHAQGGGANNSPALDGKGPTSNVPVHADRTTDVVETADVFKTTDDSVAPMVQEIFEEEGPSVTSSAAIKHGSHDIILDYLQDQSRVVSAMSKKLWYPSLDAAKAASAKRPPPSYTPPHDPSRPSTDEEVCMYVLLLTDAVCDMSKAEDNEGIRMTWAKTADAQRAKIELGVWRVVEILLDYHTRPGFVGVRPRRKNNLIGNKYGTFAAHVEKLCEIFRRQKTACRALTSEESLITIVDDPTKFELRTRNNRRINRAKKDVASENRQLAEASRKVGQSNEPDALNHLLQLASSPPTVTSSRTKRAREDSEEDKTPKRNKRGIKALVRPELLVDGPVLAKAPNQSVTVQQPAEL